MLVTDGYWNEGDPSIDNWNEGDPSVDNSIFYDSETSITLPDGRAYNTGDLQTKVFWNVEGSKYQSSLANIAFNYWAQDLRKDLDNNVPAYVPDTSTGVTDSQPYDPDATPPADNPLNNKEIYFNPRNDPATWQHVVQFMVTLGIAGDRNFPDDWPCTARGYRWRGHGQRTTTARLP